MPMTQTRRRFLTTLSLAGAAGLVGPQRALAAEGALETTTVRHGQPPWHLHCPAICRRGTAARRGLYRCPLCAAGTGINTPEAIARGEVDFGTNFASVLVSGLDHGVDDRRCSAGVHVGCFELFVNEGIRSLAELKGKKVGIDGLGSPGHLFLAAMAAHVGIDPGKDMHWVTSAPAMPMELFTSGKVDAISGLSARARRSCAPGISAR